MDLVSDRITEVILLHMNDNEVLEVYQQLLNPDIEITKFVENITGVTNDMVKSAPYINEVTDKLASWREALWIPIEEPRSEDWRGIICF